MIAVAVSGWTEEHCPPDSPGFYRPVFAKVLLRLHQGLPEDERVDVADITMRMILPPRPEYGPRSLKSAPGELYGLLSPEEQVLWAAAYAALLVNVRGDDVAMPAAAAHRLARRAINDDLNAAKTKAAEGKPHVPRAQYFAEVSNGRGRLA